MSAHIDEHQAQPSLLTDRQLRLLDTAVAIELDESSGHRLQFAARLWAQLSLPYKNPGPEPEWVRRNGQLTLRMTPGVIVGRDGSRSPGYPYGVIPRYLMTWMTTEAVRTRCPTLELGDSLSGFLRQLGLNPGGASSARLHDQLRLLTTSTVHIEDLRDEGSRWAVSGENVNVVSNYKLWFSKKDPQGQAPLIGSTITLSREFFDSILEAPVPLNPLILKALAGSPMRLDLYTWLSYRMSYLRKPSVVSWRQLSGQFGADYAVPRQFKAALERNLREVRVLCPGLNLAILPSGLRLMPSKDFQIQPAVI